LNRSRLKPPCEANWPINKNKGMTLSSYTVKRATALPLRKFNVAALSVINQ